jgi:hypothetical protein
MAKLPRSCEVLEYQFEEDLKPKVKPKEDKTEKEAAFVLNAPEISVFVVCCVMINELRALQRASHTGDLTQSAFQEKSNAVLDRLGEAVDATQRFDIVLPVLGRGEFSPCFWRWFNWWDDFLRGLTPSQIAEAERRAHEPGTLTDDLRPTGHWLEYRRTPALEPQLESEG